MRNRRRAHPAWPSKDLYVTFRRPISPDAATEPARDSAQAARDGAQGRQARSARRAASDVATALRDVLREPAQSRHAGVLAALSRSAAAGVRRGLRDPDGHARRSGRSRAVCASISATRCCRTTAAERSRRASSAGNDFMYWEVMERARAARQPPVRLSAAASAAPVPTTSSGTGASSPSRCTTSTSW